MKRSCLVIALAFVGALASDSWGQSKQNSPKTSQQNSAQQERGSEQSPAFIKIIPDKKSEDELKAENEKRISDDKLVTFTGYLANYTEALFIATALLFFATAGLVVAGFKQLKDAKRSIIAAETSAKIAERALTELEAPVLAIQFNDHGIDWGSARNITFNAVKFVIANYGRTPAHILELMDSVDEIPSDETPPAIDPAQRRGTPMPYGVMAAPQSHTQVFSTVTNINFFEGGYRLGEVINRAWFRGLVRYSDIFGGKYVMGFCFLFDPDQNRWVLRGSKEHNYCKRDDATEFPEWVHPSADKNDVRSALNRAVIEVENRK
jgi:hypothetical protein